MAKLVASDRTFPLQFPPRWNPLPAFPTSRVVESFFVTLSRILANSCERQLGEPFLDPNPTWSLNHTTVGLRLHPRRVTGSPIHRLITNLARQDEGLGAYGTARNNVMAKGVNARQNIDKTDHPAHSWNEIL